MQQMQQVAVGKTCVYACVFACVCVCVCVPFVHPDESKRSRVLREKKEEREQFVVL